MHPDSLVGLLAMFTLLAAILVVLFVFLRSLRSSKNMDAAKNTLVEDGSSAHTAVRGGSTPEHMK